MSASAVDRLNAALKGRYHVERELGAGGTATVYLARDQRHERMVALKVLKPELAAAVGAERFLAEIKTTATLQHPHILPLFDSGQADGILYYVMPFVDGETLRDRLAEMGALPVDQAIRIGSEVGRALGYAHEAGFVHRDVKPANILLSSGQATLADFGIARATEATGDVGLTMTGASIGTPSYMSPEQAGGDSVVGPASDIYSLGAVVYEMLTGRRPHEARTPQALAARLLTEDPTPVRDLRPEVPEGVERAVMRALARAPSERFPTVEAFVSALEDHGNSPSWVHVWRGWPNLRRAVRVGGLVLLVAVASVVFTRSAESLDFGERDWIVIADLENHTGDPVFDRSLNTALTVTLEQSRHVNVYPRARVQETLRRMGRDSVTILTPELAREVAIREGLKAVLAVEISALDDRYLVSTRVLAAPTGVTAYAQSVRANSKAEVLDGVDQLALRLREDLGESIASIQEYSVRLPRATTSSLEALKSFSDGAYAWRGNRWQEARTLWAQAVALDSSFAWAHASLGLAADWLDGNGAGRPHYEAALGVLDRVTERERLWIRSLTESGDDLVETLRIFTQLYPDDRDAWYNLGNAYRSVRRPREAAEAYEQSLRIDSLSAWTHTNLGLAYDALGRHEEAAEELRTAFTLDPSQRTQRNGDLNRLGGFSLLKVGDADGAQALFEEMLPLQADDRANGLRSLALLDMHRGHVAGAIGRLEEAVRLTEATASWLSEYRNRLYLASALQLAGLDARAREQLDRAYDLGLARQAAPYWLAFLARHYARIGATGRAADVLDRMIALSGASDEDRAYLEQIRGEMALARGDHETARISLERAYGLARSNDHLASMAYGHWRGGRYAEAATALEELVAQKPFGEEPHIEWLGAHLLLGWTYEEMGRTDDAVAWYGALAALWTDGDEGLPWSVEAEERLEALTR